MAEKRTYQIGPYFVHRYMLNDRHFVVDEIIRLEKKVGFRTSNVDVRWSDRTLVGLPAMIDPARVSS